jgi:hypothetical protein
MNSKLTVLTGIVALSSHLQAQPSDPGFSGRWKLVSQETSAFRGKGHIGNREEPVTIVAAPPLLTIAYDSGDPADKFAYDLTGAAVTWSEVAGETFSWKSTREGRTLKSSGRRVFRTKDGPKAFKFEETRSLNADGREMTVVLRLDMFPRDLVRTSVYGRIE